MRNGFLKFVLCYYLLGLISSSEVADRRSELFTLEKNRQREKVGRIDKIEVRYLGLPEDTTLIMNKNLSTPYNCAQRKFDNFG